MKVLIDTHIAIWAVLNDLKLPERAKISFLMKKMKYFIAQPLFGKLQLSICCIRIGFELMVVQAKAENLMFLTHDSLIPYYGEPFIISV